MLKKWANRNDCNEAILFLLDSNKHGHMMKANIFIDGGCLSKEIYFFIKYNHYNRILIIN